MYYCCLIIRIAIYYSFGYYDLAKQLNSSYNLSAKTLCNYGLQQWF